MKRLLLVLNFLVLGPLFGSLIVAAFAMIFEILSGKMTFHILLAPYLIIPFGYIFGALPSAVTGVVISIADGMVRENYLPKISFVVGFISSFMMSIIMTKQKAEYFIGYIGFGLIGGLSALWVIKYLKKKKKIT